MTVSARSLLTLSLWLAVNRAARDFADLQRANAPLAEQHAAAGRWQLMYALVEHDAWGMWAEDQSRDERREAVR
ncbi:MAG: hypothetical protein Q8S13_02245 [Dehalococcoidia bacterium]|nr:hypothetical protein [Dehalococcoidia bacterium]